MKFQPDILDGVNPITRHDPASIWVASTAFRHSVVVPWRGLVLPWSATQIEELQASDFEALLDLRPEVVIFGSGPVLRFAPPVLMRSLFSQRIGVETMDTAAACRTYNVLVAEGREVVAALLLAPPKAA